MQITRQGIKPCSQCYKARQFMKDSLGNLRDRPATHIQVTTPEGIWVIERAGNTFVELPPHYSQDLMGRRVYIAGKKIIDVELASPLSGVGPVTRTEKLWR